MKKIVAALLIAASASGFSDLYAGERIKFQSAMFENRYDILEKMLKAGFKVDTPDEDGVTPLMLAAQYRSADLVKFLLAKGADVNRKGSRHRTPLIYAAGVSTEFVNKTSSASDKLAVINLLLNSGAGVNDRDTLLDWTPLLFAAHDSKNTDLKIIDTLLKKKADPLYKSKEGTTALLLAAASLRFDTVQLLINRGADVNAVESTGRLKSPLSEAVSSEAGVAAYNTGIPVKKFAEDKMKIIKLLLAKGANPGFRDEAGSSPAHMALRLVDGTTEEILKLLKKHGADFNVKDSQGVTPAGLLNNMYRDGSITAEDRERYKALLVSLGAADEKPVDSDATHHLIGAIFRSSTGEVDMFLAKGADINGENENGFTPLLAALNSGNMMKMVPYIVSKGADVNMVSRKHGCSILLYIAGSSSNSTVRAMGYIEIYKFLISKGADVNSVNREGQTPMMLAAVTGDLEVIRLLTAKKADINKRDNAGMNALMHACFHRREKPVLELLISSGIDLKAVDKDGRTAMSYAASSGWSEIVKTLTEKGASLNEADNEGITPLMRAVMEYPSGDIVSMARYMISKGADPKVKDKKGRSVLDHARETQKRYRGAASVVVEALERDGVR